MKLAPSGFEGLKPGGRALRETIPQEQLAFLGRNREQLQLPNLVSRQRGALDDRPPWPANDLGRQGQEELVGVSLTDRLGVQLRAALAQQTAHAQLCPQQPHDLREGGLLGPQHKDTGSGFKILDSLRRGCTGDEHYRLEIGEAKELAIKRKVAR